MHETNSPLIQGTARVLLNGVPLNLTDAGRIWLARPRPHTTPRSKQGVIVKPRRWARARHRRK